MVRMLNFHVFISEGYCVGCLQVSLTGMDSTVKHSTPKFAAILMRDSVAILFTSGPNPAQIPTD